MKILFLSHYFPPEGNAPASRVHSMCRRWVALGHDVTVITGVPNVPNGVPYEGYRNRWYQKEEVDGIRVVRCWTYLAPNKGTVRRILNYLSYSVVATWRGIRAARPDVVVATSPQFFCGWAGVWVARAKRLPFVLEIRDIWPESIRAVGALGQRDSDDRPGLLMRYLERLERHLYAAAAHIVTVGLGYRARLLERGVRKDRVTVITNGVETALFEPRPPDPGLRAEAGASDDDFLVGYVGTVGMAHGLEVVVEAGSIARTRGLDRLRFVIVGDGARLDDLRSRLDRDDPGNVRLLGRRPKSQIPDWLASIDACLVHLRATELFASVLPSKIFEAFAMSRPILVGVPGEARELVSRAGAGLWFEPEDAEALVAAAAKFAALPDDGAGMGHAGREMALEHYRLDTLAERYLELLRQVAHRDGRSR